LSTKMLLPFPNFFRSIVCRLFQQVFGFPRFGYYYSATGNDTDKLSSLFSLSYNHSVFFFHTTIFFHRLTISGSLFSDAFPLTMENTIYNS
jgi:hypothetical protein